MSEATDREESLKIRILLVDDNQIFRRVATDFLQRHRELVVVSAVCGGEEALAQAQRLQPQVILIDLDTPGLSGMTTIPRLRTMFSGVSIIALTLLTGQIYRQAALAAGADDFVAKAALITDLLPAIRRVTQTPNAAEAGLGKNQ